MKLSRVAFAVFMGTASLLGLKPDADDNGIQLKMDEAMAGPVVNPDTPGPVTPPSTPLNPCDPCGGPNTPPVTDSQGSPITRTPHDQLLLVIQNRNGDLVGDWYYLNMYNEASGAGKMTQESWNTEQNDGGDNRIKLTPAEIAEFGLPTKFGGYEAFDAAAPDKLWLDDYQQLKIISSAFEDYDIRRADQIDDGATREAVKDAAADILETVKGLRIKQVAEVIVHNPVGAQRGMPAYFKLPTQTA